MDQVGDRLHRAGASVYFRHTRGDGVAGVDLSPAWNWPWRWSALRGLERDAMRELALRGIRPDNEVADVVLPITYDVPAGFDATPVAAALGAAWDGECVVRDGAAVRLQVRARPDGSARLVPELESGPPWRWRATLALTEQLDRAIERRGGTRVRYTRPRGASAPQAPSRGPRATPAGRKVSTC